MSATLVQNLLGIYTEHPEEATEGFRTTLYNIAMSNTGLQKTEDGVKSPTGDQQ